jgi:hypothetical protein
MEKPALPSWWREASQNLSTPRQSTSVVAKASIDTAAVAALLCRRGFAVVDGFLGAPAATAAVLAGIQRLDRDGRLRLGKIQQGTTQAANTESRTDRIAFLPSVQPQAAERARKSAAGPGSAPTAPTIPFDECDEALHAYARAADAMRAALSEHPRLVEKVGGRLDDCTYMCACYPGGGARYVKHRDALPYKAGRKLVRARTLPTPRPRPRAHARTRTNSARAAGKMHAARRVGQWLRSGAAVEADSVRAYVWSRRVPQTVIYYLNAHWQPGHGGELRIWPATSGGDGDAQRAASAAGEGGTTAEDASAEPVVVAPVADRLVLFISSLEHEVLPAWRPRFALTTWMFNKKDTAMELLAEEMRQRKAAGKLDTKALLAALDADSSSEEDDDEGTDEGEEDSVSRKQGMAVMMMLLKRKQQREKEARAAAARSDEAA